jgi:hypothetical protein
MSFLSDRLARGRIHYGWYVAGIIFVTLLVAAGIRTTILISLMIGGQPAAPAWVATRAAQGEQSGVGDVACEPLG